MSSCQICTNDYGGKVVPTILTCCLADICFDCGEKDRVAKISNLTGNRKKIQCMLCNKEFHSANDTPWIVNMPLIRSNGIEVDMSAVRQAQAARQQTHTSTSTSSSQRRSQSTRHQETDQNDGGEEEEDTAVVVSRTARQGQQQLRRSKRRKVNTEVINEDGDDNSNAATFSNEEGSIAYEQNNSDEGSDIDEEENIELDENAKQWMKEMSKPNLNVYRIRCYNTESVTDEDPYARKTAQWCVNNGYTITCLELAKILPEHQRQDGEALKERVISMDNDALRRECQQAQDYDYNNEGGSYVKSYRQFIEMKKGDIIALHTTGSYTITHPQPALTFGVVQDDDLIVMDKEKAIQEHGFPWNFINPGKTSTYRIGLMVRKVKWYRQGELRAVRGLSQVNWLAEFQPIWMGKVGVKTEKYLKQAIKNMSSKKFLNNAHAIDNEWTMS